MLDEPLTEGDYAEFKAHLEALCFWGQAKARMGIDANHWHFHPREFIGQFRKCEWLSLGETIGLLPATFKSYSEMETILTTGHHIKGKKIEQILPPMLYINLNKAACKYGLSSPIRKAQFMGQVVLESDHLQTVTEYANGSAYEPSSPDKAVRDKAQELGNVNIGDGARFKGRGIIQTTGKANYQKYGAYRGINMTDGDNNLRFERDAYAASDSAGLYWVSEKTRDKKLVKNGKTHVEEKKWVLDGFANISKRADQSSFNGLKDIVSIKASVSSVTRQINRAELALDERTKFFTHAYSALSDLTNELTQNLRKK